MPKPSSTASVIGLVPQNLMFLLIPDVAISWLWLGHFVAANAAAAAVSSHEGHGDRDERFTQTAPGRALLDPSHLCLLDPDVFDLCCGGTDPRAGTAMRVDFRRRGVRDTGGWLTTFARWVCAVH